MSNIQATLENNTLTIFLDGRIDSNNAEPIEKDVLKAIAQSPGAEIVLDAESLDYISSAGLRVLMRVRKQMGKPVPVVNVSPEVYEIFNVTGFTELMDVKKRLREISVDGCELIGEGASGKVYRIEDDMIAKVFHPGVSLERIESERINAKTAFLNGIPTAITFDVVKCGERYGTVYELIDAVQLSKYMWAHPEKAQEYQIKYGKMMKDMHQVHMSDEFLDMKEVYKKWFRDLSRFFTDEESKALSDFVDLIPDRDTFVHCDCHVGNIMVQNGELVLIDMADVGRGHPIFDLGAEFFHYKITPNSPSRNYSLQTMLGFIPETNEFTDSIWHNLITTYFQPKNEEEYRMINMIALAGGQLRSIATAAKHSQLADEHKQLIIMGARKNFFPKIEEFKKIIMGMDNFFI